MKCDSHWRDYFCVDQRPQVVVQQAGDVATRNEYTSLHVLFHRVTSQVRAGDEANPAVGDSNLGVDSTVCK